VSTQQPGEKAAERAAGGEDTRKDETRKMAAMDAWLDEVCAGLGVDREFVRASTPGMLRLIGRVAHGPSRPGAPLTAFVVGLAAAGAAAADDADDVEARTAAVLERVDAVGTLVDGWKERQG
jgi:hypothetical protein